LNLYFFKEFQKADTEVFAFCVLGLLPVSREIASRGNISARFHLHALALSLFKFIQSF